MLGLGFKYLRSTRNCVRLVLQYFFRAWRRDCQPCGRLGTAGTVGLGAPVACSLAVMEAAAARLGVQLIKQYPAKEQAELKVKVQIPGSWFGWSLTPEEKRELYWAQAKGSSEAHKFPAPADRAPKLSRDAPLGQPI